MKTKYLLPPVFKKIGWWASIPFVVFWACTLLKIVPDEWQFLYSEFFMNLFIIGFVVTLCFIAFSQERDEDEYIARIRYESLIWATIFNYVILVVASLSIYGLDFFVFMGVNMYTILILFIAKFNIALYRLRKSA